MASRTVPPVGRAHGSGFLVAVLGPDGAGKSTLIRGLRGMAPGWYFASLQPEDIYPLDGAPGYNSWALTTHPREYVAHMRPLTRVSFFTHVLAMAWEYRMRPQLDAGAVVVSDSYWYRAAVKESVHHPGAAFLLEALAATLPEPDLVVWLDVPLTEAWRRNGTPTVFEVDGTVPSREAYLRFQERVLGAVRNLVPAHVPQVQIDATRPPADVARSVRAAIDAASDERCRPLRVERAS